MKYLRYLLYIVFGLLTCFLLVGLFVKQVEYSSEVTVNKPAKEAWAVYQDESKMKDWLEGFESIKLTKGEKNEIGSEYLVTINQDGETFEIKEILNSFKEFENVNFDFDNDFMLMNYNIDFLDSEGSTKIKSHSIVQPHGLFMRAMTPLIKGSMIAQEEKHMNDLKKVIESNTTDYFPIEIIEVDTLRRENQ